MLDLSADISLIADDDYIRQVVESGNYMKPEGGKAEEGSNEESKEENKTNAKVPGEGDDHEEKG